MIEITMTAPEDAIFNIPLLIQGCEAAVRETNRETKKILDDTKKDFSSDSQFEFKQEQQTTLKETRASTWTDNENWIRLNDGFTIRPVAGKFMAFRADYRPKTRPASLKSRPGGQTGPWVYTYKRKGPTEVQGRHFISSAVFVEEIKFRKRIDAAYKAAIKA